jgi:flagellar motor component MotA
MVDLSKEDKMRKRHVNFLMEMMELNKRGASNEEKTKLMEKEVEAMKVDMVEVKKNARSKT